MLGAIQKLRHAKGKEGFSKMLPTVTKREGGVSMKRYVAKSVNSVTKRERGVSKILEVA